ncbi:fumarylacetoacetate hydrolase family protein [Citricoccus sp. K5]|uniref:fumarylacetoacetate hydrolase family protein n=1 Tax=Citricoccus sp. K5 TaxID=2653135 RepID=UPI0012EFF285|nr:fumarylacetoacetate hydrolase family protein [Citricoccus sp. K5]VXB65587.1 Fumarylacetoacetate (FAA) hydrolase family protein [Citricoccus sp. K5]
MPAISRLVSTQDVLPADSNALLVGRLSVPEVGPALVAVHGDRLVDITSAGPTMSDLLDREDVPGAVREALGSGAQSWSVAEVLRASMAGEAAAATLLAPFDLSAVKAAGVTFAKSMVERVIEEHARGDLAAAEGIRKRLGPVIENATSVVPGSEEAARIKESMVAEGLWSQYLEVGIGPDPEIFSKAQVLSSVGFGAHIGVLERSTWNNPEPEVVLAVNSRGQAVGATLGNDVNLRDFEGRSALLLTEAKDNNASSSMGPFIRVFDEGFTLSDLRDTSVRMSIHGEDGFTLSAVSRVSEMSRTFEELISHAWGSHHQYPDGFALYTGTMFAPTEDRDVPGDGFTHHRGDQVLIHSEALGTLANTVTTSEDAAPWTFGIREFMANLAARGVLK